MGGLIERGFKREFTSVVRARTCLGSKLVQVSSFIICEVCWMMLDFADLYRFVVLNFMKLDKLTSQVIRTLACVICFNFLSPSEH